MATANSNTLEYILRMNAAQFVAATANAQRQFSQSMRGMRNSAAEERTRINTAMSEIGVRPVREINAEIQRLRMAYQQLAASGRTSVQDLARAQDHLNERVRTLRQEITDTNGSFQNLHYTVIGLVATTATLKATVGGMVSLFVSFDDTMRAVKAKSGATEEQWQRMIKTAEHLGATTRYSATQVAEGFEQLATAGFSAEKSMDVLPTVLHLAAAGTTDLGSATAIVTSVMAGFDIQAKDIGKVSDALVKGFLSAGTSLSELGLGFSYVGPVAKAAGLEFNEVVAVLGLLADAGIRGERGGTALRGALSSLLKPAGEASKVMDSLGIEVKTSEGKLVSFVEILDRLKKSGATVTDIMTIFGVEAGPGMLKMLSKGVPALEELIKNLDESGGTAESVAKGLESGLGGALRTLSSSADALGITIGRDLAPVIHLLAQGLTTINNILTNLSPATRTYLEIMFGAGSAFAVWTFALGPLISGIRTFTAAQITATGAVTAFGVAFRAAGWVGLALVVYEVATALWEWVAGTDAATETTQKNTEATENSNAAMKKFSAASTATVADMKKASTVTDEATEAFNRLGDAAEESGEKVVKSAEQMAKAVQSAADTEIDAIKRKIAVGLLSEQQALEQILQAKRRAASETEQIASQEIAIIKRKVANNVITEQQGIAEIRALYARTTQDKSDIANQEVAIIRAKVQAGVMAESDAINQIRQMLIAAQDEKIAISERTLEYIIQLFGRESEEYRAAVAQMSGAALELERIRTESSARATSAIVEDAARQQRAHASAAAARASNTAAKRDDYEFPTHTMRRGNQSVNSQLPAQITMGSIRAMDKFEEAAMYFKNLSANIAMEWQNTQRRLLVDHGPWTAGKFSSGGTVFGPTVGDAFSLLKSPKVPGVGNKDTVPASLPVGSFVIKKKAANYYGDTILRTLRNRVPAFAKGGAVSAMLTPGEWVFSPEAVGKHGTGFMAALNAMQFPKEAISRAMSSPKIQQFAAGGAVGNSPPSTGPLERFDIRLNGQPVASTLDAPSQLRGLLDELKRTSRGLA